MSDNIPPPLTPLECDLQDFPFMPLQVARLRDSDLAAEESPEACWFAVLLWAAAWHQIPAASLPDNDTVLMKLCGLGRDNRTWKRHRAGALRGFVKCSDGRLYHPVVAEQAVAAWERKIEQKWRSECARIRKHNQRHNTDFEAPALDEFKAGGCLPIPLDRREMSNGTGTNGHAGQGDLSHGTRPDVPRETASNRQGQGQGQGESEEVQEPSLLPRPSDEAGDAPAGATKRYAFAGRTVRLTQADFERWERAYHAIPDLSAELESLDCWLQEQPEAKRKKWFHTVAGALSRKHQEILALAREQQAGGSSVPAGIC